MNQDQRFKLMNVLLDEAAICHDRGDHEDCRALTIQSTRLRFHEEIERIKQGDKKLLDQFERCNIVRIEMPRWCLDISSWLSWKIRNS